MTRAGHSLRQSVDVIGFGVVVAVLIALLAAPALAQAPAETGPQPPATIASRTAATDDADIAKRIRDIFDQIDGLEAVDVDVSAGVVRLEGSVVSPAQSESAAAIAERVAGVVTVQNGLERNVEVTSSVTPALSKFRADLARVVEALPLIGVAIALGAAIAAFGYWLTGLATLWRWITPNPFLAELVTSSMRVVFFILGAVIALQILGATALLGAVLGGAGVVGIALGFAVRDTVDNYVSSLMLSLRQPFRANDHIVLGDQEGRVVRLTSRATILMTLDGNHLRIPNAIVFKSVILNYTRNPERRFEFDLGIDAEDDALQAIATGLSALRKLDFVLDAPKATAFIQEVGDSNIVLRFYGWVDQRGTDFLKGRSLGIQATKTALEGAGFSLPEPIYRLRFDADKTFPVATKPGRPQTPSTLRTRSPAVESEDLDTAPTPDVERMVREERTEMPPGDLLDDSKPIE